MTSASAKTMAPINSRTVRPGQRRSTSCNSGIEIIAEFCGQELADLDDLRAKGPYRTVRMARYFVAVLAIADTGVSAFSATSAGGLSLATSR